MTLKELAINHPYYASESNYYSKDASSSYQTMSEFISEFTDADIDMNLIYRWDVHKHDKVETYWAEVFIIHQRKGIYSPVVIHHFAEDEVSAFVSLVSKHKEKLLELWKPIA